MYHRIVTVAMLLAIFIAGTVQPSMAGFRDKDDPITLPRPASSLREVSRFDTDRDIQIQAKELRTIDDVRRYIPIGDSYTTPPPPPQKYHVWYILPDLGLVLDCVYDDDTGELKYCDIYA